MRSDVKFAKNRFGVPKAWINIFWLVIMTVYIFYFFRDFLEKYIW
jgi:hypothetical protein